MQNKEHMLEHATAERDYFSAINSNGKAAYRRAVTATTQALPTWATRKPGGRPRRKPEPVRCAFDSPA